jgi:sensor c-di-GMP phosphodiesterase-like protein
MAKQKKKRNKQYQGAGASVTRPVVTRISAANRNPVQQWWFEKKRIAKPVSIASGVVVLIIWLVYELIRILTN